MAAFPGGEASSEGAPGTENPGTIQAASQPSRNLDSVGIFPSVEGQTDEASGTGNHAIIQAVSQSSRNPSSMGIFPGVEAQNEEVLNNPLGEVLRLYMEIASDLRELSAQVADLQRRSPNILQIQNSARGSLEPHFGLPPAARVAVDCLPLVAIEQIHLEYGSAICAICTEDFSLGDSCTQLPCMHLYHRDCILPWLRRSNSCPVCRRELPRY